MASYYHYTSIEGLKGIIENKSLRFTDCQFLNDTSEYTHIKSLLKKIKKTDDEKYPIFLDTIIEELSENYMKVKKEDGIYRAFRYFVFSTCKSSDSLPMWNYYTKDGKNYGYNIEIDVNDIAVPIGTELTYSPIIYLEAEKINKIKEILDTYYKKYIESKSNFNYENMYEAIQDCLRELERIRLCFKDECFKHEEEFRIIAMVPISFKSSSEEFKRGARYIFTPQNGVLRPQFEIKFNNHNESIIAINSITISPLVDFELAKKGLIYFFIQNEIKLDQSKIKKSKLPIRF